MQILAATAEQAEKRARALLVILDHGFSRPIQMGLFKLRTEFCEELRKTNEKLATTLKELEDTSAKLKEYEEFTPDMLSGLRVQQLQLEVDLAGVKAKIRTCERLLAKTQGIAERSKPIEEAMIAAEIELSGFEARRAKSAEFVGKVKQRNELEAKQTSGTTLIANLRRNQRSLTRKIGQTDEEIAAFAPVTLVDDRVTIHPLEWTQ